jgi:hypothetical protein
MDSRGTVVAALNRMWVGAITYYDSEHVQDGKVVPKRFPGKAGIHLTPDCCKSPAACAGDPKWTSEEPWKSLDFAPPEHSEQLRFDFRSSGTDSNAEFISIVAVDGKCTGHPTYVWRRGHVNAAGDVTGQLSPSSGDRLPDLTDASIVR